MKKYKTIDIATINFVITNDLPGIPFVEFGFEESLHKVVARVLGKYKIRSIGHEPGGKGGGGLDGLSEVLKELWRNREFISFVVTILKVSGDLFRMQRMKLQSKRLSSSRPRMKLYLWIETDCPLNVMPHFIESHMIALKFIADQVCNELSAEFPLYVFDQSVSQTIKNMSFKVSFNIPYEFQNKNSLQRYIGLIRRLPVRHQSYMEFEFLTDRFIQRIDSDLVIRDRSTSYKQKKKYFILLSNNVISDYFSPK